jgi:hypothetical protein
MFPETEPSETTGSRRREGDQTSIRGRAGRVQRVGLTRVRDKVVSV